MDWRNFKPPSTGLNFLINIKEENSMEEAKLSSRGQLVIPKYLRDALGLNEGDTVVMTQTENKIMLMKKPADPLASLSTQGSTMKNIRREIKDE